MRKTLKVLSLLILIMMVTSIFAGCNQENGSTKNLNTTENNSITGEKPVVSMVVYDRGGANYEDNETTRWIEENSPVSIKWVPVPRNPYEEKINLLLASGDIPDVIQTYNLTYAQRLVDQEMFRTIGDLVDKYGPNIKKYISKELIDTFAYYKGGYYFLLAPRPTDEQNGMYIRTDWLSNLGLEKPDSVDDFYTVAAAFTKNDPDNNGENDTFGYDYTYSGITNLLTIFDCVYSSEGLKMIDGKATSTIFTENFVDMLKFARKLADEGIIDKEYVTDTQGTGGRMKFFQGRLGILPTLWHDTNLKTILDNNPDAKFEGLRPFKYNGERNGFYEVPPISIYLLISEEAKHPDAAIKWFDWLVDEGYYTLNYGIEGIHHKKTADGKIEQIPEDVPTWWGGYTFDFAYCRIGTPIFEDSLPEKYKYAGRVQDNYHKLLQEDKYVRDAYWPNIESISKYEADINKMLEEYVNKIIVGGVSVEEGVQYIRDEYKKRGGDNVSQAYTEWYNENVKK